MRSLESSKAILNRESSQYFSKSGQQWFNKALQVLTTSKQITDDLGLYSAMAKRKLGVDRLQNSTTIETRSDSLDIRHWTISDAARMILLMTAIECNPGQAESIITAYYRMGDESESMALVRGLILFAPNAYLTKIALDVGRTNSLEVLAALTLDNPYPACFYSEVEFNQMVLKALFLGLAIERISGIEQRANPDLTRMGESYVVEREEAGRSVPVDTWLAIGPYASETGRQQMIKYLNNEEVGHRYYCTLSLTQRLPQDSSLLPVLKQRLDIEQEPQILNLMQNSLLTS